MRRDEQDLDFEDFDNYLPTLTRVVERPEWPVAAARSEIAVTRINKGIARMRTTIDSMRNRDTVKRQPFRNPTPYYHVPWFWVALACCSYILWVGIDSLLGSD